MIDRQETEIYQSETIPHYVIAIKYKKKKRKIRSQRSVSDRKTDSLILSNEFTIAEISQSSGETFRSCITRRRKMDSAPSHGRHEFIITITSRRSYLIAEVAIRIYLAICRDCLQIGGFLHVLLSFRAYA